MLFFSNGVGCRVDDGVMDALAQPWARRPARRRRGRAASLRRRSGRCGSTAMGAGGGGAVRCLVSEDCGDPEERRQCAAAAAGGEAFFEKEMDGVAYSSGAEIHISANWVRSHPNDFGMVIHELTHLVQRYPRNRVPAGWLVEGIADYVRLGYFEPLIPRPRIDFTKAKYTDAYKTTAGFLLWLEGKYGADLVPKLNAALRAGTYTDALFKEATGKEVAELWSDFAAAQADTK